MFIAGGHAKCRVLRHLGLSKSTYYHRCQPRGERRRKGGRPIAGFSWTTVGQQITDEIIKQYLLAAIEGDGAHYGYRKLTHQLRREFDLVINKKKVYRLCREMNALHPQRRRRQQVSCKRTRNRIVSGPNQVWASDVKYGYIEGESRYFYMASVLDIYDRSIVGCHIGLNCQGRHILQLVQQGIKERGANAARLVLRTDNGTQYKSRVLARGCATLGVQHEYIPAKTPDANAHIESFHAILEKECLAESRFGSYLSALTEVRDFLKFYNERRLHSGCGYRPPLEYYREVQAGQLTRTELHI